MTISPPRVSDAHCHAVAIRGVISCFDCMLIQGTLPDIAHARAMTQYLKGRRIRIFDSTRFAVPLREAIRENAERVADQHGLTIAFIRNIKAFRKEDRVQEIVAERGTHSADHIVAGERLSAMRLPRLRGRAGL